MRKMTKDGRRQLEREIDIRLAIGRTFMSRMNIIY